MGLESYIQYILNNGTIQSTSIRLSDVSVSPVPKVQRSIDAFTLHHSVLCFELTTAALLLILLLRSSGSSISSALLLLWYELVW